MSEITALEEQRRQWYTLESLAEILAVSKRTVRDWTRAGKLPYYKLGGAIRIDPADVDTFLAQRRHEERSAA